MSILSATPAPTPVRATEATASRRLPDLLVALKARIARIGLPARLDRLSDHQLQDAGLHRGDIDWLRTQGSSQDSATQLALRARQRAGNW